MSNSRFINLDARITKLKNVIKDIDTNTLSTYCFWEMFRFGTLGERIELQSPAKQVQYLFGIVCATSEPATPSENSDAKLKQVVTLLNDIFGKYALAYLPTKDDLKSGLEEEWHRVRDVAMPMFSNYFFEGFKISTDNFKDIIKTYYDGFESEIKNNFGINHNEMLEILDLIGSVIQEKYDRSRQIISILKIEHEKIKEVDAEDFDKFMSEIISRTGHLAKELYELMNESVTFNFDSIRSVLGDESVDSFIDIFVTERGKSSEIKYITDDNPFSYKPIVTVNYRDFMLPSINAIYEAILLNVDVFFRKSKHAEKFRKSRDSRLESETYCAFKNFFPKSSIIIESVFETNTSHNEHDLIILNERTIIIVEAKASPRRAPLRDPTKAYIRLRDDFKRKSGIQSASDQANNLRRLILENVDTPLYDKKGNLLFTVHNSDYDNIYCICITKDDFGMLATDLTLMLEKGNDEPFPWVISIQDFKFLINCLTEIGLTYTYLIEYISERIKVHGKAIGNDELEFAGAYLNYGNFDFITKEKHSKLFLDISESRVFDEIHLEKINGRKYIHEVKKPKYGVFDVNKLLPKFKVSGRNKEKNKTKRKNQRESRKKNR